MDRQYKMDKPEFKKLKSIEPGVHGYFVYVKIIAVEPEEQNHITGTCGDETGIIKFRFPSQYKELLKADNVVAIRNGKSEVYQEKHKLALNIWGNITKEEKDIKVDETSKKNNMSEIEYERVNKGNNRNRRN